MLPIGQQTLTNSSVQGGNEDDRWFADYPVRFDHLSPDRYSKRVIELIVVPRTVAIVARITSGHLIPHQFSDIRICSQFGKPRKSTAQQDKVTVRLNPRYAFSCHTFVTAYFLSIYSRLRSGRALRIPNPNGLPSHERSSHRGSCQTTPRSAIQRQLSGNKWRLAAIG